jgi:tetratricopeptide (TPR) repeat protein
MAPDDVDRMAEALAILGAAERQSGDLAKALATFEDARARLRALVEADPQAPATARRRGAIAHATVLIGQIYQARGKNDDALAAYREAAETYAEARGQAPRDTDLLRGAADAHDRVGDILRNTGNPVAARDEYERARNLRQDAVDLAGGPEAVADDLAIRFDLSTSEMKLGSAAQNGGDTRLALEHYRKAVAMREELVAAAPDRLGFQHGLAFIRNTIADLLRETGALAEARATYEQALAGLEQLVRRDPDNTEWRRDRGTALANLGFVLYDLGDARGALARYVEALDNHAILTARDPDNASWQMDVSRAWTRRGDAHLHVGEVDEALAAHEAARVIRERFVANDPKNVPWRRALAWSYHKVAICLPHAGRLDDAFAPAKQALEIRQALHQAVPKVAGIKNELALSEMALGRLESKAGRRAEAMTWLDASLARSRELVDADPDNLEWKESLASTLVVRGEAQLGGDDAAARREAEEALALAEAVIADQPDAPAWQVIAAESHWILARAGGGDAHRAAARALLAPLAEAGRLGFEKRELARAVGVDLP